MKRNKIMVLMAALALTAVLEFSGCSDKVASESDAFTEDSAAPLDFPDVETDVEAQNSSSKEETNIAFDSNFRTENDDVSKTETDSDETPSNVTGSYNSNSSETLDGILMQIDTDSFKVNEIFTAETEEKDRSTNHLFQSWEKRSLLTFKNLFRYHSNKLLIIFPSPLVLEYEDYFRYTHLLLHSLQHQEVSEGIRLHQ